jgi:hypothetical protein
MRQPAIDTRIREFMSALGKAARDETRIYFTGGTSAVLLGWRTSTIHVDLSFEPEREELLRQLPGLKEHLELNIELVVPSQFNPELPGWKERSEFIGREGLISFFHYDFYSQALAKIERGHEQDLRDVRSMLDSGRVRRDRLRELFVVIEPSLCRYPAVDPRSFRAAVDEVLKTGEDRS